MKLGERFTWSKLTETLADRENESLALRIFGLFPWVLVFHNAHEILRIKYFGVPFLTLCHGIDDDSVISSALRNVFQNRPVSDHGMDGIQASEVKLEFNNKCGCYVM